MTICGTPVRAFIGLLIVVYATGSPYINNLEDFEEGPDFIKFRPKRPQILEECMVVGLEENTYFFKGKGLEDVCGLFLVASTEQRIEITLESLSSNCETGLVSFLDGWEMGGEVFPPAQDAPMDKRVRDFCGRDQKRLFVTSSNAATVLYKLPSPGDKFKLSVRFLRHPKPCNVLLVGDPAIVTLQNHGLKRNCSVATTNPSAFKVLQIAVGIGSREAIHVPSHQESLRCSNGRHAAIDRVEIGGSSGLDTFHLQRDQTLCGTNPKPKLPWARVWCDVTAVRLVSSGYFENFVTVAINPLSDLELLPTTVCQPLQ